MAEPFATFTSALIPLPAENVDTDQIIPARFLKTTEKSGLADALFNDWRYDADGTPKPDFVLNRPEMQGRQVLLAGDNFGCGSSREHAPWALTSWGIRAILSTSFADIFRNNSLKNGLLPIVVDADTHAQLFEQLAADPDAEVTVDLEAQPSTCPATRTSPSQVDPFARQMLLAGTDEIGWLLARTEAIDAWEAGHPARIDTRPTSDTRPRSHGLTGGLRTLVHSEPPPRPPSDHLGDTDRCPPCPTTDPPTRPSATRPR